MAASFDLEKRVIRMRDATAKVHICEANGHPQPWFQAKPIVVHLGYGPTHVQQTLSKLPEKHRKSLGELMEGELSGSSPLGHNERIATYLSEAGLFELLCKSEMPAARPFQDWLFEEVLPTIRRTGSYSLAQPSVQRELQELRAAVEALQASHSVLEVARGGAGDRAEQQWLLEHGRDASAERDTFLAQQPLDLAGYLASRLPAEHHWVIRHIKGEFAREVKRRRVALYEETGDRFWVARAQAQWRLAYVAADRDVMDQVWADEVTQQYLERQLAACRLAAPCARAPARMRVTHGPYRRPPQGGSAQVTRQALTAFFGASE
jgi:prophage antirepressor-like protein